MTRKKKTTKKTSRLAKLIPESAQNFIARRIQDALAITLCAYALFLCGSLLTYNMSDPSLNTSVSEGTPIHNVFGQMGSNTADLLLQTFGLASFALALTSFVWGVRLWRRQSLRPLTFRITALISTMILMSVALSRIPSSDWLPQTYSGGAGGLQILSALSGGIAFLFGGWSFTIIALVCGLLSLLTLSITLPITRAQWKLVLGIIKATAINLCTTAIKMAFRFSDWIKHHNDPSYVPPHRPALEKKITKPAAKPTQTAQAKSAPTPVQQVAPAQSVSEERDIAVVAPKAASQVKSTGTPQGSLSLGDEDWEFPDVNLLKETPKNQDEHIDEQALKRNAELLQNVLEDYKVEGEIVSIHPGPVVTLYEFEPSPGTKSSRVIGLSDDIARSMSAMSVRASVVPGRNVIGIEIPNKTRQTVYMRDMLETDAYVNTKAKLPLILGKDIGGGPIIADLAKMPHLLVAGTTGSGKSVGINTMLLSLLYKLSPEKCRLIMIDPKMLELSVYNLSLIHI